VLSGRAWPARGGARRRALLALNPASAAVLAWSVAAGGCAIAALAGLWIVFSQITPWTPNLLPSLAGVPASTVAVLLVVGCLAAPLSEEAAFRGYAQGLIQRVMPPWTAVVVVSLMFAAVHLTQGLFPGKLMVYFLAGLTFGAVARLAGSIVPSIAVHVMADAAFFTLVWPHDGLRRLVSQGGADLWFWIHLGQVAVFAPLALLAFVQLARAAKAGNLPVAPPTRFRPCPPPFSGVSRGFINHSRAA
jgi:membrane protease YdiL (CAAX protease family)